MTEELSSNKEKTYIANQINNKGEPDLIITWLNPVDWYWVHFKSNTLPATRYWVWLRMRYVTVDRYTWENFSENEMIKEFIADSNIEKPNYALVDKKHSAIPEFFVSYLNQNYSVIFTGEEYDLYKRN